MNDDLISYYKDRAKEYESIYSKPERQDDLLTAAAILQEAFNNKDLFEIGCGTGYWTEKIAQNATSVFATDINESVLEIARNKEYINSNVKFGVADFYSYQDSNSYEGVFGGFIWSHIQQQDLIGFISKVNSFALPGGQIAFMDNNYVEGSNHPIIYTDEEGNTFQRRALEDGTTHLVRKNFPSEAFIRKKLSGLAGDIKFHNLKYYWIAIYTP